MKQHETWMAQRLAAAAWMLGALLFAALVLWLSATWSFRLGVAELAREGQVQLNLYVAYLRGILEKYEAVPELLADQQPLIDVLLEPTDRSQIDRINRYLERVNLISGASETYLMDRQGTTLAASNWQKQQSFVGLNFAFRPYFQQAMEGKLGRYFAIGTTSNRRGYYFAFPVRREEVILGVVVTKVDLADIEKHWGSSEQLFVVTDVDGIVFLASDPRWLFHSFGNLSEADRQRIRANQRYPGRQIHSVNIVDASELESVQLLTLSALPGLPHLRNSRFVHQTWDMPEAGWQVQVLSDIERVRAGVLRTLLVVLVLISFAYLAIQLLRNRQRLQRERAAYEAQARQALQKAHDRLEERVAERTRELTETNEDLRQTRDELIQAAKLATLGELSASINHELNQPLAAIRSYADNGRLLLQHGRTQEVDTNLQLIGELVDRMARIGAQLKQFARKSGGELQRLSINGPIQAALMIVAPRAHKVGAKIEVSKVDPAWQVIGEEVLLQQVLVNLMGNAVQAVTSAERQEVRVSVQQHGDHFSVLIEDSGPGIDDDDLDRVFEPFFTTKRGSDGLGLGLSISARIARELGGSLVAGRGALGGAALDLSLPVASASGMST